MFHVGFASYEHRTTLWIGCVYLGRTNLLFDFMFEWIWLYYAVNKRTFSFSWIELNSIEFSMCNVIVAVSFIAQHIPFTRILYRNERKREKYLKLIKYLICVLSWMFCRHLLRCDLFYVSFYFFLVSILLARKMFQIFKAIKIYLQAVPSSRALQPQGFISYAWTKYSNWQWTKQNG